MLTFWPSTNPATPRPWRNASKEPWAKLVGDRVLRNPTTGTPGCARAASGHAAVMPPSRVTNSRRFTASGSRASGKKDSTPGRGLLRCGISIRPMSALGQKRTKRHLGAMSALPPKADKQEKARLVRFVPKADSCTAAKVPLFDHLVGEREHFVRDCEAECPGGFEIEH